MRESNTFLSCPGCGSHKLHVSDSRQFRDENATRRRRTCGICGHRWSTVEVTLDKAAMIHDVPLVRRISALDQKSHKTLMNFLEWVEGTSNHGAATSTCREGVR